MIYFVRYINLLSTIKHFLLYLMFDYMSFDSRDMMNIIQTFFLIQFLPLIVNKKLIGNKTVIFKIIDLF